jgi:hypothetical protein
LEGIPAGSWRGGYPYFSGFDGILGEHSDNNIATFGGVMGDE